MARADKISTFDPSGPGQQNGHFIGLPFDEEDAQLVVLSVPWEVTVSYGAGTARAAANILQASTQLDLEDPDVAEAWKLGLYLRPASESWLELNDKLRAEAASYIRFLEAGGHPSRNPEMNRLLAHLNEYCGNLQIWVKEECTRLLEAGKQVGLLGGDHSVPLGLLQSLAEKEGSFGVLQIDAHMDLRTAYEGFTFSHASIFSHVLQLPQVTRLVQVGIRDWCEEETQAARRQGDRLRVFYDHQLKRQQFAGTPFREITREIIAALPAKVYVSFDIDGLDPRYCPRTGTPVPGGLDFQEAIYLLVQLVESGRRIIGFDLCEVAGEGHEWDGNVGARLLYKLANLMGKSQGLLGSREGLQAEDMG